MKKKVGLITIYHVPNYGSVLQTYATQILLEELGLDCNIINYKYPNEYHHSLGRPRRSLKSKIGELFGLTPSHRKANKLKKFKKEHFKFTKLYRHLNELKHENWDNYDMFVVGSDQVWKSKYTLGDTAFLLSFVPEGKKRISIASSFATSSIPENYRETYKRVSSLLSKYQFIFDYLKSLLRGAWLKTVSPEKALRLGIILSRRKFIRIRIQSPFPRPGFLL